MSITIYYGDHEEKTLHTMDFHFQLESSDEEDEPETIKVG